MSETSTVAKMSLTVALVVVALFAPLTGLSAQAVRVIKSTEPPAWGTSVRLVPEMHIGEIDGDEEYLLGRVRNVAIGHNGAVIVADGKTPVLRMYDSSGKFVRDIGRAGEGPGEYRSTGGVRTLPDGRILLWDNRIQRLTYYSADGAVIKSVRVPSGLYTVDLFHVSRDGTAYVRTVTGAVANNSNWQFGWIRVSPNGTVVDTIAVPHDDKPVDSFVLSTASGFDRPFTREFVSTMSNSGALLFGESTSYAFEQRQAGQQTIRIERAYLPVKILGDERREWDAWARYMEGRSRGQFTNDKVVQQTAVRPRSYVIPREKPAFSELASDADGRIWVRRYVTAVSLPADARKPGDPRPRRVWGEQPTFDVFEPGGRFLGTVILPWSTQFEDAKGMLVWATATGELGEETVVRYRISLR